MTSSRSWKCDLMQACSNTVSHVSLCDFLLSLETDCDLFRFLFILPGPTLLGGGWQGDMPRGHAFPLFCEIFFSIKSLLAVSLFTLPSTFKVLERPLFARCNSNVYRFMRKHTFLSGEVLTESYVLRVCEYLFEKEVIDDVEELFVLGSEETRAVKFLLDIAQFRWCWRHYRKVSMMANLTKI